MINIFLYAVLYFSLAGTCITLVLFFMLLCEGYEMTKAQKPVKMVVEHEDIGLSRWELNRIVGQVIKNDKKRIRRGYRW